MSAFEREVCQRLPLADAVYQLLDFVTADGFLDDVQNYDKQEEHHRTIERLPNQRPGPVSFSHMHGLADQDKLGYQCGFDGC